MNIVSLSVDRLKEAVRVKQRIEALQKRMLNIFDVPSGTRTMSPDARERIANAQRKRWAAFRKNNRRK